MSATSGAEHGSFRPAIFLDRDGTILDYVPYLSSPEQVKLIEGAATALAELAAAGYLLIIVSNQSGIGRGYYSESDLTAVTNELESALAVHGVSINLMLHCPHTPADSCDCRKPLPGMALTAGKHLNIDLANSFVVGDNCSDMGFGRSIGATTILVKTGLGEQQMESCASLCDHVVSSIKQVTEIVADRPIT